MENQNLKKTLLVIAAAVCAILLISPADLLPGAALDDILYLLGAIASARAVRNINRNDNVYDYTEQ